ncbi:MAG TPA: hypothetical protein GXX70_06515 [Tepidimicrobium sp.]|nr:hypothetical protein [Tepidimicrobium sp.]
MITNDISREFVLELKDLDFSLQEYIVLTGELEEGEAKKVNNIKNTKEKLEKLFEILNERQRLPEEYRGRVENYKGFEGLELDFDILI